MNSKETGATSTMKKKNLIFLSLLLAVWAVTMLVPQSGYALIVNNGSTYNNSGIVEDYVWIAQ